MSAVGASLLRIRACPCAAGPGDLRERRRLLDLTALLEHPDALPAHLALRLGMDLLALTAEANSRFVCDAIGDTSP